LELELRLSACQNSDNTLSEKRRGSTIFQILLSPSIGLLEAFPKHVNDNQQDFDADMYGLM
jgi:hypothetical protein